MKKGPIKFEIVRGSGPGFVDPPCPYFGECGGCQLQHMTLDRQIEEKSRWLCETLDTFVAHEKIFPIIPSPKPWNYRRRIQVHVGPRGEVGFFAMGSQRVVDIQECLIAEQKLNEALPKIREMAGEALQDRRRPSRLSYEATLNEEGEVEISRGEGERLFLQVNPGANELLKKFLKEKLTALKVEKIMELHAGNGNLTYALCRPDQDWTAVEVQAEAFEAGRALAVRAGLKVRWILGKDSQVLKKFATQKEKFDLVLMDPPREGLREGWEALEKIRPPWIVYISCHLPALKRDLGRLSRIQYAVEWVQAFDFFPHTMNLETVVLCRHSQSRQV